MTSYNAKLAEAFQSNEKEILEKWIADLTVTAKRDGISMEDVRGETQRFLQAFLGAYATVKDDNISLAEWTSAKDILESVSINRAKKGFSPSETATFVFSLKQPLFEVTRDVFANDAATMATAMWGLTTTLDKLGLYTTEVYQKGREEIIMRQQQDMLELSTPVVKLWDGVLALPMIGTLDSSRTQVVMETLLQQIVETGATIAIIDITGVPTVDTLVAQHLLKTVAAARLMGADCIISGIRPQIAQTIVHLGVDLNSVITKATLADAFLVALTRLNQQIVGKAA